MPTLSNSFHSKVQVSCLRIDMSKCWLRGEEDLLVSPSEVGLNVPISRKVRWWHKAAMVDSTAALSAVRGVPC